MDKTIQAKENPAIANMRPTRRRAGIAGSMYEDAKRLKKTQAALLGMASALELNQLPTYLETVKSRKDVESILSSYRYIQYQKNEVNPKGVLKGPSKLEVSFSKLYHSDVYQGEDEPKIRSNGSVYNISLEWAKDKKIISPELFKQAKKFIRPDGEDSNQSIKTDSAKEAERIKNVLETAKLVNDRLYVKPATSKTKNRVKIDGKDYEVYFKGKTYMVYSESTYNLLRLGFKTVSEVDKAGQFLNDLINQGGINPENEKKAKIKELERDLIGRKIPGFFPTPRTLGEHLLEQSDIEPGMSVLEPSAGKGDLADQIQEKTGIEPDTIEMNSSLREILTEKNHKLVGWNFLEYEDKTYDRIIMNPPFENGQDIEHVRHAYDLLNPGGRLVAIVSEGPFYRSDTKARTFRDWLLENGGYSEQLPENSFSGKDSFRQTSVRTRLVVMDKPLKPNALSESMKGNKNAEGAHNVENTIPESELITKEPKSPVFEEVQGTKEEITKQKVSEINLLKSALPAGTKVTFNEDGQEGIISKSKLVDGELYYELTNGKTVFSGSVKIPPLEVPKEIDDKISSANPENRAQVRKAIIGTSKTEDEATKEIETEKIEFKPGTVNHWVLKKGITENKDILDYSKAPIDKIILFNEKTILERTKPTYIPDINARDFRSFNYSFPKIRVGDDKYLVQIVPSDLKFEYGAYLGESEPEYILMNADSLVASEHYYRTLIKAKLKKEYERAGKRKRIKIKEPTSNQMASSQYELISHQLFGEKISLLEREKDKQIWEYYRDQQQSLVYKAFDLKFRTSDRIEESTYSKGRETSYGDSGVKNDLFSDYGVQVKRQNGSSISEIEINQVKEALSDVFDAFGNRSEMAKKFGLKISHSGEVLMHARKALGLFFPYYKAIGVSFKGGITRGSLTLAHEFGHFMDFYVGKQKNQIYASEKIGSIENQIASIFRSGMRSELNSAYFTRTCECFARAFEMYFFDKKHNVEDYDPKYNPSWEYFRSNVQPLIEQFFDVNKDYLKSEIFGIVFKKKKDREIIKVA
ncbi:methyltransferase [Leptospira licerasiae]|uniref:methyltransferase n=1 Tax=Leptospira licerasiae TaxID=447106 RepID=UPI001FEF869D|nr:methyltransferase [Leptospira licerasiae]